MSAISTNGRIYIENIQNKDEELNKILMNLKTSNGSIKVNMNDPDDKGYKISAKTTLNGINLLIPNLKYTKPANTSGNKVDAETENYSLSKNQVEIKAETTNGYIEIGK